MSVADVRIKAAPATDRRAHQVLFNSLQSQDFTQRKVLKVQVQCEFPVKFRPSQKMRRVRFANRLSAARNGAESTPFPGREDPGAMTTQLKRELAGPTAKALVEDVIAALEQGLSEGFDRATHLEALKPKLDVLIKMSEDMAAAMRSQVDVCNEARAQALQKIGDCNDKKQALEERLVNINADIARDIVAAAEDEKKAQVLRDEIEENKKISELEQNRTALAMWLWVPGHSGYVIGKVMDDYCKQRQPILEARLQQVENELRSTSERQRSTEAVVRNLSREKYAMEGEMHNLNESIKLLDKKSKAYARRLADFHEAKVFYRLLSSEIENLRGSLGLPKIVERLLDSKELVLIAGDEAGQQEQSTLKELLMHLGGEYDFYLENGLPEINDSVA